MSRVSLERRIDAGYAIVRCDMCDSEIRVPEASVYSHPAILLFIDAHEGCSGEVRYVIDLTHEIDGVDDVDGPGG